MERTIELIVIARLLRLLTHVGFLRQILSEVFLYMGRSKNCKKHIITVQQNFTFLRRFDRKNTVLEYRET